MSQSKSPLGLVLSGGGARGAYQSGVLKAIAEISTDAGIAQPFPIITGVSAGAINASYLAATCDNFLQGAQNLTDLWSRITSQQVFHTDAFSATFSGLRLLTDAALGAMYKKKLARSLLDTAPLRRLLSESIPFGQIRKNLDQGFLRAFAITAMDYSDSFSVTFIEAAEKVELWSRSRRRSEMGAIGPEHVMASAAIPLFFPPVRIGADHYGDGCLRNTAPLSPAIHLGSNRLIVISVRRPDSVGVAPPPDIEPTIARVLGVMLNAILLDSIDSDMERLIRINNTVSTVPETNREHLLLKKVESLWLRPSVDIGHLAGELFHKLPNVIRYMVGGLGSSTEASELTSYLLFDPEYCCELIRIGYADGLANREEILKFIQPTD
jgi:NTE family protein